MKITFRDGKQIKGKTFREVVEKLKNIDATQPDTINEYMNKAKKRYKFADVNTNTSSPEKFIKSLANQNVLELELIKNV